MSSLIIGIDLGTTYSSAAMFLFNNVKLIPNDEGKLLIPSMVAFNDDQVLVGEEVEYQMVTNPDNSIYQIKRIIGRKFDDKSVKENMNRWPFKVVKSEENNQCQVKVRFNKSNKLFSPEEISAQVIKKVKQMSEKYIGQFIHDAVISVPAYFNNNQKAATRNAGLIAGLNVKHIINEPTAAALAYGFGRDEDDTNTKNILVYDLGGGTFDISILRICGREFKVLAIKGDSHLGGEDFTNRMVNHLFSKFASGQMMSVKMSHQMRHRLREACEKGKRKLSEDGCRSFDVELDSFYIKNALDKVDLYTSLSRETFEKINGDLFNMTMELVDKCIEDSKLNVNEIDEVILVGGSSRIPKIRKMMRDKFGSMKVNTSMNPEESVAMGAAIEAAILCGDSSEALKNMKLVNVTPLSLGVRVELDDRMKVFIPRNTKIPTEKLHPLYTLHDNQRSCVFPIYEGENEFTKDNIYLGKFTIDNLPPGPAGSVRFDVTFNLDENGILNVTSVETSTKKSGSIAIKNDFGRLSDEEIQHLIKKGKLMEEVGKLNESKAHKKRRIEKYLYDVDHFLLKESAEEKINMKIFRKCHALVLSTRNFLLKCDENDPLESEFESRLNELKSVCDPSLNELFRDEEGRNIGESQ